MAGKYTYFGEYSASWTFSEVVIFRIIHRTKKIPISNAKLLLRKPTVWVIYLHEYQTYTLCFLKIYIKVFKEQGQLVGEQVAQNVPTTFIKLLPKKFFPLFLLQN